jgi:hypothetical protein
MVSQGTPLLSGTADVPEFNRDALVAALRTDQAGKSTFPEFLRAGTPVLCATMSISRHAHARISGVTARSTSKITPKYLLIRVNRRESTTRPALPIDAITTPASRRSE